MLRLKLAEQTTANFRRDRGSPVTVALTLPVRPGCCSLSQTSPISRVDTLPLRVVAAAELFVSVRRERILFALARQPSGGSIPNLVRFAAEEVADELEDVAVRIPPTLVLPSPSTPFVTGLTTAVGEGTLPLADMKLRDDDDD